MKKLLFLFGFFLFTIHAISQDATISGHVIDITTNSPLPYATITVSNKQDGKILTGIMTSEDGRFSIKGLPSGEYIVTGSFIGYKEYKTEILIGRLNKYFDLGRMDMEPDIEALDEVVVSAVKNLVNVLPEKRSFDIAGNISQTGGSVLDAMRNLPGINIDQEGKVELRGSDKVSVLIDGKQSSLTGYGNQKSLDNIPASNIERIEIINNPSARYDASGMAGVINIISKKEIKESLNGDVGFSTGLGVLTKRKDDVPSDLGSYHFNPKYAPSLNINYRKGKFNIFLQSELLNQKRLPNNEFTTRYYEDGKITISQVPENRKQTQYIIKGGADMDLNDNNIISFSAIYDYENHHDTAQVPYLSLPSMTRYRYWSWLEYEITGYMNYSLAWKHKFAEPGHELNTSVQYTKGWEDETYHLNDSSSVRVSNDLTHIIATEHTYNLTADYIKPLKGGRMETGIKVQGRRIPVTYTTEQGPQSIIYPGLGDWSDWGEDIAAGYFNWIRERKKLDIEAGIRVEQTWVFYNLSPENIYYSQDDSYRYFKLFPSIRITYKVNDKNSLSVYINKRVDRPGEPELRVFPKYDDPELLKVGNPYLRPQFTNTAEIAYKLGWKSGSASFSLYYKSIKDPFTRIYSIDTTNNLYDIINKIYHNVGSATNMGLELIFSQDITGFWRMTLSTNIYNNTINAYQDTLLFPFKRPFSINKTSEYSSDIKLINQWNFPTGTQIQVSALYYTPKNIPQGKQYVRSSIDAGIKQILLKGNGEFTFSFTDIFNTFGIKQKINGEGFSLDYENFYETQILRLGFKYKF